MVTHSGTKPRRLPDQLLSEGVPTFDTAEAARRIGLSRDRVHGGLKRLSDAGEIFSAARGFYVIIPAQYRSWGAVPASWFVDPMMAHLDRGYYVGLLSAAEAHGAAHQRPQVFQVVVDKYLPDRAFGRVRMQIVVNRHVAALPVTTMNTPTRTMRVSTPEVTALDLVSRPLHGGGLDNVATVLIEFNEEHRLDVSVLVELVDRYPMGSLRRLGHLLERFCDVDLDELHAEIGPAGGEPAPLDPGGPRRGHVDPRWNVRLNAEIEPDL